MLSIKSQIKTIGNMIIKILNRVKHGVFKKHHVINEIDPHLSSIAFRELNEGVFFINSNFEIQPGYTSVLEKIIDEKDLLNRNFIKLLENRIPEDNIRSTEEYFTFLFREDLDEETIFELNPLSKIEFHFKDSLGLWTSSKYLSFKFKRIYYNEKITLTLCVVEDISAETMLNVQLEKSNEHNRNQTEWMMNILHIKPDFMKEFMNVIEFKLNKIEKLLQDSMDSGDYVEVAEEMGNSIQMITRNISVLNLKFFEESANLLQVEMEKIQSKTTIAGSDFVSVVVHLGDLRKKFNEIQILVSQLEKFKNSLRTTRRYEGELLIGTLEKLIDEIGDEVGKKIRFVHTNFNSRDIPYVYQDLMKQFLFTLTRFVVLYSIESTEERRSANIDPVATIELETMVEQNRHIIKYRHNGKLVKTERYLQEEIESNLPDEYTHETSDDTSELDSKVLQLFFAPLTSVDADDENAEEQMQDIQLIKKKLNKHGGRIKITFTSEESVEYIITLPRR